MSTTTSNSSGKRAPRVLIVNDDGPPAPNSSPFVFPFSNALREQLGWEVKVVVPSSQVSEPSLFLFEYDLVYYNTIAN